jgi:hypothetical protein
MPTQIQGGFISDNSVDATEIATNSVTSTELQSDATVNNNRAVTTNHIRDNAVTASKIATNAVFPSGTLMLFQQTSAPTGWTKQTTHNDKVLRVVSETAGFGGDTAFTSVFTSRTPSGSNTGGSVSEHTLTIEQMPSHNHSVYASGTGGGVGVVNLNRVKGNGTVEGPYNNFITSTGGGQSHSHGFTNPTFTGTPMNFNVQYVDLIIASKI